MLCRLPTEDAGEDTRKLVHSGQQGVLALLQKCHFRRRHEACNVIERLGFPALLRIPLQPLRQPLTQGCDDDILLSIAQTALFDRFHQTHAVLRRHSHVLQLRLHGQGMLPHDLLLASRVSDLCHQTADRVDLLNQGVHTGEFTMQQGRSESAG